MSAHVSRHRSRLAAAAPPLRARRALITVTTIGTLVVGVVAVGTLARASSPAPSTTCPPGALPLHVAAAPEIAPILARAAASAAAHDPDHCPTATVTPVEPAQTAAVLRSGAAAPDVWVPESSIWTAQLGHFAASSEKAASVARSPYVLAVPRQLASALKPSVDTLNLPDLVPAGQVSPVQWALVDPQQSAGTVAAVLGLQETLAGRADSAATLTQILRSSKRDLGTGSRLGSLSAAATAGFAVPVTEQQVAAHNALFPETPLVAAYPNTAVPADYPFVVLTTDEARRARAGKLFTAVHGADARAELAAAGFRTADGEAAAPTLPGKAGVDPNRPASGPVPATKDVDAAAQTLTNVTRSSRLLVVLDVSGSMGTPVPGGRGASRLDVAVQTAVNGLARYPDDTVAGLWTFSTDHRQVVPLVALGRGADGANGRQRLAEGLASVEVTDGWTALYETLLAAVREVRKDWDPKRVSSVVIVTDGANENPRGGLDLPTLVQTLRQEHDPARPVPVFAIAYGPSGDLSALRQVSEVTGGQAYAAHDPRTIGEVMLDAIGRRACASRC